MPERLQNHTAVTWGSQIYLAGGSAFVPGGTLGQNETSNRFYRYETETGAWVRLADLPAARHNMPMVVADQHLYAVGGIFSTPFVAADTTIPQSFMGRNLWRYDPDADAWSQLSPLPAKRGGATAQVIDGRIYVAGGIEDDLAASGTGFPSTIEILADSLLVYDIGSDSWTAGPPIPSRRQLPSSVTVDGRLYTIGGSLPSAVSVNSLEVFDPTDGSWSRNGWVPVDFAGDAVRTGGVTYLMGRVIRRLDLTSAQLERVGQRPLDRWASAVAAVGGRLYVFGGGTTQGGFNMTDEAWRFAPES